MATLNENIAEIKTIFREIKAVINRNLADDSGKVSSSTPLYIYPSAVDFACIDQHNAGRQYVVDNSKCIPKTATGKVISLTDVSEVAHKVKVYGDNQEVEVFDNFLRQPYYQNNFTSSGVEWEVNDDGSVSAVGTSTAVSNFQMATSLPLESGKTYTFRTGSTNVTVLVTYTVNGSTKYLITTSAEANLAWGDGYELVSFGIRVLAGVTVDEIVYPVIYESGTKQIITATPVGTEIDSMCPNMTFITYSDAEANLAVEYYSSFGMNEEWSRFWDALQANGSRLKYDHAFRNSFSNQTFKPKYDIVATSASQMFYESPITDLAGILKKQGVILDTQKCTNAAHMFTSSKVSRLPLLDFSVVISINSIFYRATNLRHIEGIVSSETTPWNNNDIFGYASAFEHCIFSGVIASDINLQWSPLLDDESAVSLLKCLKENNNYVATVTLHPDVWARLDAMPAETWGEAGNAREYISNKGWFFA